MELQCHIFGDQAVWLVYRTLYKESEWAPNEATLSTSLYNMYTMAGVYVDMDGFGCADFILL